MARELLRNCAHNMTDQTALIARTASRMDVIGLFFMSFEVLYGLAPRVVQPVFLEAIVKEEPNELVGEVTLVLPGMMFRVALPSGHEVVAQVSGKLRRRFVRLRVGDKVNLEMSPGHPGEARIVFRQG